MKTKKQIQEALAKIAGGLTLPQLSLLVHFADFLGSEVQGKK